MSDTLSKDSVGYAIYGGGGLHPDEKKNSASFGLTGEPVSGKFLLH